MRYVATNADQNCNVVLLQKLNEKSSELRSVLYFLLVPAEPGLDVLNFRPLF